MMLNEKRRQGGEEEVEGYSCYSVLREGEGGGGGGTASPAQPTYTYALDTVVLLSVLIMNTQKSKRRRR